MKRQDFLTPQSCKQAKHHKHIERQSPEWYPKGVLPVVMSVGVGFALVENTVLLTEDFSAATLVWAALRGLSSSLMHRRWWELACPM